MREQITNKFMYEQNILKRAFDCIEECNSHCKAGEDATACISIDDYSQLAAEYQLLLERLQKVLKEKTEIQLAAVDRENKLIEQIQVDVLTQVYSRRYLEERVRRLIKQLSRVEGVLSVMVLDVDNFKEYNDTYGHLEGDTCLRGIAQCIADCLPREDDFVARYGGDEFVIVLPNTGEMGASIVGNRILQMIQEAGIVEQKQSGVTVSIGFTTAKVKHTQKYKEYIRYADQALAVGKASGKNILQFAKFE